MRSIGNRMLVAAMSMAVLSIVLTGAAWAADEPDPVAKAVADYFDRSFAGLKAVADAQPTRQTFRAAMKPLVDNTEGFFGGTLIDTNFVIAEVYLRRDALARGYDLKRVKELTAFWQKMREKPEPQLSEPGHGNLMQPRLVAMRYPFLDPDGKLLGIVSMMVRTPAFLQETKLDACSAFQIVVDGKVREEKGKLSASPRTFKLVLPSTEWTITYDP